PSNTPRGSTRSSESSYRPAAPAIPTPSPLRHTARTSPTPCPPPPSSAPPSRSSSRGRCVRSSPRSRAVSNDQIFLWPSKFAPQLLLPLNPLYDFVADIGRRLLVA